MRKYENGKYQKLQNSDDTEDNINQRTMNRNLITNRIKLNKYINNNLRNNKLNALIFFITELFLKYYYYSYISYNQKLNRRIIIIMKKILNKLIIKKKKILNQLIKPIMEKKKIKMK